MATHGTNTWNAAPRRQRPGSWRLGRVAGVDIELHWTWAIAFALVTASLAATVFPPAAPGLPGAVYLIMGVASAIALFGSILLHELGHAWQAGREGVPTDRVTLWVFGGIAQMRRRFPSAGAEFRIAIAGPLVTLALIVVFLGASSLIAAPAAGRHRRRMARLRQRDPARLQPAAGAPARRRPGALAPRSGREAGTSSRRPGPPPRSAASSRSR